MAPGLSDCLTANSQITPCLPIIIPLPTRPPVAGVPVVSALHQANRRAEGHQPGRTIGLLLPRRFGLGLLNDDLIHVMVPLSGVLRPAASPVPAVVSGRRTGLWRGNALRPV